MREKKIASPLPFYCAALCFIILAFILPMYKLYGWLICIAVFVASYLILRRLIPGKTVLIEEPEAPPETGNEEADALIVAGRASLAEFRRLNAAIAHPGISARIDELEEVSGRIFKLLEEKPDRLPQVRKFMNYYLPTTLKLLQSYERLDAQGAGGENISAAKERIEKLMDEVVSSFRKQLDRLFEGEAMDITADVAVMEMMLEREGLKS